MNCIWPGWTETATIKRQVQARAAESRGRRAVRSDAGGTASLAQSAITAQVLRPLRRLGIDLFNAPADRDVPASYPAGTARAATSDEVKALRKEARDLKEVVDEQALELQILKKKHHRGWGPRRMRYPASEKPEIIQRSNSNSVQ